jgi:hypothetical protein
MEYNSGMGTLVGLVSQLLSLRDTCGFKATKRPVTFVHIELEQCTYAIIPVLTRIGSRPKGSPATNESALGDPVSTQCLQWHHRYTNSVLSSKQTARRSHPTLTRRRRPCKTTKAGNLHGLDSAYDKSVQEIICVFASKTWTLLNQAKRPDQGHVASALITRSVTLNFQYTPHPHLPRQIGVDKTVFTTATLLPAPSGGERAVPTVTALAACHLSSICSSLPISIP